jgi:hypothetical protein
MRLKQKTLRRPRRIVCAFLLFQRGLMPDTVTDPAVQSDDERPDFSRIRCPLCKWQPNASSIWQCNDRGYPEYFFGGCGTLWNTFDTRGLCPGCGHQWRWTGSLWCHNWSPHQDWYAKDTQ